MSAELKTNNDTLVAMLLQLDETLKQVVNGTGAVNAIATTLKQGNEINAKSQESAVEVAVRLTEESKQKFEELKSQIISTADEITENYRKELTDTETELTNKMGKEYVAQSEFGEYKADIETQFSQTAEALKLGAENTESIQTELSEYKKTNAAEISLQRDSIISEVQASFLSKADGEVIEELISSKTEQTAKDITDNFTQQLSVVNDELKSVSDGTNEFIEEINAYIKRGELETDIYGIEIGRSDSVFKTRFTNDEMAFYQGGVKVAYISSNILHITRAEILDYIQIGNSEDGYFIFDVSKNGLEVKYRG